MTTKMEYHLKSTAYHSAEHIAEPEPAFQGFLWKFDEFRKGVVVEGQREH